MQAKQLKTKSGLGLQIPYVSPRKVRQPQSTRGNAINQSQSAIETSAFHQIAASNARLALIVAPPGYGKTGLLDALEGAAVAAKRKVSRLGTNIDGDCGEADLHLLDNADELSPSTLARLISNFLAGSSGAQLAIAARSLANVDQLSLTLREDVLFLGSADLKLDPIETEAFIRRYLGAHPMIETVRRVFTITEGWPVAVRAMARALGKTAYSGDAFASVPGELKEYIARSLFQNRDDKQQAALLQLAEFERFSPRMIEAVAGVSAAATVQRLIDEGHMMVRLPGEEPWYRLHGMYRQFLLDCRRARHFNIDHDLLRKAAHWATTNGAPGDAIDCLLRCGNHQEAQQLLLANIKQIVEQQGDLPRLINWTTEIASAGHHIAVPLRLWRIWALIFTLRLRSAADELAEIAGDIGADAPVEWRAHYEKLNLSIAARQDLHPAHIVEQAEAWLACWGEQEPFHAAAANVLLGMAHSECGAEAAERLAFAAARQCAHRAGSDYARVAVAIHEAWVDLRCGRIKEARHLIEAQVADAVECDRSGSLRATASSIAARIFVELGDMDAARRHLAMLDSARSDQGMIDSLLTELEASTALQEYSEGCDSALAVLRRGKFAGMRYDIAAKMLTTSLLLRHGRTDEAAEIFEATVQRKDNIYLHAVSRAPLSLQSTLQARKAEAYFAFAKDDCKRAVELCKALLPTVESHKCTAMQVSLLMLDAAANHRLGDQTIAVRQLTRALQIAGSRSLFFSFLSDSWVVLPLLASEFVGLGQDAAALVQKAREIHGLAQTDEDDVWCDEKLTPREQEILTLLDSGLTSERLAEHLQIGQSTTKWHIQNIYNKLGVRNRSGALAKARRLALIR